MPGWASGWPLYDPADITVPVLLVHAEWDADVSVELARAYFATLSNARYRRWVEIGEGTHRILLQRNRMQAYRAVSQFLGESDPY